MTAVAARVATPSGHESYSLRASLSQVLILARRSVLGTFRRPATFVPTLVFPLFMASVNTAAMGRAINIPGFPAVESMLDFLLAATVTQGVLFGGITAGADTAVDIESGFWDRLLASPVSRTYLLIGRLAGAAVLGAVQATIFTTVFLLFGASIKGGVGGFVVLVIFGALLALFVGGFAAALALRTGSAEAVQNFFPVTFIMLFISSAFFPTVLMTGVYRKIADNNPVTWMIDGIRHQVIVGFDAGEALISLAIVSALAAATITLANAALRARIRAS